MKILAVECSAGPVSCALTENGRVLGEYYMNIKCTHSQTLMPMIDGLLKGTGTELSEVGLLAVAAGPGSFTGLRIGIAAVKGLAFHDSKPCCAVSTLEGVAYGLASVNGTVCVCMDARCGQVYNAIFRIQDGRVERLCPDRAIALSELEKELVAEKYGRDMLLAGDGAELAARALGEGVDYLSLAVENLRFQRACGVAFAAEVMYNNGDAVTAEELLPVYLRLPQAERELRARAHADTAR